MNLKLSYRLKFSLSIIMILLAFGILLSLIIGTIAAQALLKENQKRGITHALNLQARMVEPLLARDFLQAKILVDTLRQADQDLSYSFVLDKNGKPFASTFSGGFPVDLGQANPVDDQEEYHLRLLKTGSELIYDVAAPIIVSRNRLGTVRIGMARSQVQDVINRLLWSIFVAIGLGLVAAVLVGNALAYAATRKLMALHHAAQEIIKGNLDVKTARVPSRQCWEINHCRRQECPAYGDTRHRCWHLQDTLCATCDAGDYSHTIGACNQCAVYKSISGDEIQDLAEFFDVMVLTLRDRLQALESSEERYRLLVSNVPAVVFTGYADWTVDFYDHKIEKLIGYPREEFSSRRLQWLDVILEEDRAAARKIFLTALRGDKSYVREYRVTTKELKIIWIQEISRIICDRGGKVQHVSGLFFDITDHKRAEEALQQSHAALENRVQERTVHMQNLLAKQELNIELAKNIVRLVNGAPPRYTATSQGIELFVQVISMPCNAEGGDHYLVRNFPPEAPNKHGKTIISLKDQSGHEVSCVLKGIITDLMHNAILYNYHNLFLEEAIAKLNEKICDAGIFAPEDFITSINVEINHDTLKMRYLSNGHPPFLLIRGPKIIGLPDPAAEGLNLPLGISSGIKYSAGEYQLEVGDKLIFYTDGLSEMPHKNYQKTISYNELSELVEKIITAQASSPVSEIMSTLLTRIAAISNEEVIPYRKNTSTDDITILGVELENHNNYYQEIWRPHNADEVERLIGELYAALKMEWDRHGYASPELRLPLVLEEAIFNAWEHGNKRDPEKSIIVRWRYGNDCRLEIIDAGQGFDHTHLPDPTARDRLLDPRGRGLFILRHFADQVRWQQGGSHLVIIFTKQATDPEQKFGRQPEKLMQLWKRDDIS